MFLEAWIHQQIDNGLSIQDVQSLKLKDTVAYAHKQSPYYRDSLDRSGIQPNNIQSLDDLGLLPFTSPESLREESHRFLCVSLSQIKRIFTLYTGGTSGNPRSVFFSRRDLDRITDYMGAAVRSVAKSGGISHKEFSAYILLPDGGPESQQRMLATGITRTGGRPILGDLTCTAKEHIERIADSKPDVIFGSVSRIYRITQEAKGMHDLSKLGVRVVFITSEYVPQAMRERLQGTWGAEVFTHYGMTELGWAGGIECQTHQGLHFNELDILLEVVNPETGAILTNGDEGELVLTTLNREAMPLIRYKTGDLGRLVHKGCTCGTHSLSRISTKITKSQSIVELASGDNISPPTLDDVFYRIPHIIDYCSSLIKNGNKEQLTFEIEVTQIWPSAHEDINEALLSVPAIRQNLQSGLMTAPKIDFLEQGEIKRKGRAKKLINDMRFE